MKDEIYKKMSEVFDGDIPREVSDLIGSYVLLKGNLISRGKELSRLRGIISQHIKASSLSAADSRFLQSLGGSDGR